MSASGYLLAASGGLALFLADYPACQSWLACVAFVPLFWTVLRARSLGEASGLGAAWGAGRTLPLAWMVHGFGLPWTARVAVGGYLLLLDAVFGLCIFWCRATAPRLFLSAVLFAAIEHADSLLPMWGTARSVARLVAPVAGARVLTNVAGTSAVTVFLVASQALAAAGVRRRQGFTLVAGLVMLASVMALGIRRPTPPTRTLRASAIGWGERRGALDVAHLVGEASARGARLVVFPEAAFELPLRKPRSVFEAEWSRIALEHGVFLVVPFIDRQVPGNRLFVFNAQGMKLGEYTKQHLVPLAERFPPGDGDLLIFEVDGVHVGTLICQDDNFRDLARAYSVRGAELLVIPTFEGPAAVAPYHFRNSVLRAIENPVALLRATAQGESAVVAPGGEVVASLDHAAHGTFVLTADIPIIEREQGGAGQARR